MSGPSRTAKWLAAHPAPIHRAAVPEWAEHVRAELGDTALDDLVELLEHAHLDQQYQSVAAARALGAEVWADGAEPDLAWIVRLPGGSSERRVRPEHQLAG